MSDVTRILNAIEEGDTSAAEELLPLVYEELRCLAAQKLSLETPGQTLQATALVHEAYLKLVRGEQTWENRRHFFVAAAEAMRRILIENARRKKSIKGGGGRQRISLDDVNLAIDSPPEVLMVLDEAMRTLGKNEPEVADLIKLRFFGGQTLKQSAEMLEIPQRTAERYWAYARAWLYSEIHK